VKHFLLPFIAALVMFAQAHETSQLNSCIKEFYDPGMYNYLTFQNTCTKSLTLVLVAKDGSAAGGTMELRPGGKDSVGLSHGKVPKRGSFQLYVCQTGYVPVDDSNQVVSKPTGSFRCQQKTQ
jgi:hypothetical protein